MLEAVEAEGSAGTGLSSYSEVRGNWRASASKLSEQATLEERPGDSQARGAGAWWKGIGAEKLSSSLSPANAGRSCCRLSQGSYLDLNLALQTG